MFLLTKQSPGEDGPHKSLFQQLLSRHGVRLTALRSTGETELCCSWDDSSTWTLLLQKVEGRGARLNLEASIPDSQPCGALAERQRWPGSSAVPAALRN